MIASIEERIVSPSLVLHRLGSYARQNSVYQALSEIGRVQDDETLSHVKPLLRKHINPFGRYHFDLDRIQKALARSAASPQRRFSVGCGYYPWYS